MHKILETRRERIRRLINLAISDGNTVKQFQGYHLLNEVNRRLSAAYSMAGMYSNLY